MSLPSAQVAATDLAKRVYVGNLYYELKENDIREYFAPFGSIHSIDLSMEPGIGRSKGFCFIEYQDVLAAESAVQVLNGTVLSNRALRVGRPHRGNSADNAAAQKIGEEAIKNVSTKCIYVGGVRVELTSHQVESIFSPFGDIRVCVMTPVSPQESTMHRGYGFIEFTDEASATNAIQHMNGFELAGQKLKVGKASPSAVAYNLARSTDKVLRIHGTGDAERSLVMRNKTVVLEDADIDAVKDVSEPSPTTTRSEPKRCVCLRNMVAKGDVDADLREEVSAECALFGSVERVEIHELTDHVRIFVVFNAEDSASKAKAALHGRFFGGNRVQADFYSLAELTSGRFESAFLE
ncbi:hypothetical protein PINS_up013642 [Pythium insidiosum]|nr:hypothetical protein PINS_up013642 [Pythium insidiosum]